MKVSISSTTSGRPAAGAVAAGVATKGAGAGSGRGAPGGQAEQALGQPCQQRTGVAQTHQGFQPGRAVQPARRVTEQPAAPARAVAGDALGEVFGLDQRHVDVGFALALAALAGDAEVHGLGQGGIGQRLLGQVAVQRGLEQLHAATGGEVLVAADAEARAHHLLALGFALAAVDAHRHRLGEVAAMSGNVGIGVAHARVLVGGPVEEGFSSGVLLPANGGEREAKGRAGGD
ncbi:hypothetical protein ACFS3C_01290 [Azotobacter vinelandii]